MSDYDYDQEARSRIEHQKFLSARTARYVDKKFERQAAIGRLVDTSRKCQELGCFGKEDAFDEEQRKALDALNTVLAHLKDLDS